jgi:hypothetical protein
VPYGCGVGRINSIFLSLDGEHREEFVASNLVEANANTQL